MLEAIRLHKLEWHTWVSHFLVVLVFALFVGEGIVWGNGYVVQVMGGSAVDVLQVAI